MASHQTARTTRIKARALGPALVWEEARLIRWPAQSARDLLFFFLEQPEAYRDRVIVTLWQDDATHERLVSRFASALWRLRRELGREAIVCLDSKYQPGGIYRLNVEIDYDVKNFDRALAEARCLRTSAAYREALNLYTGHYLADVQEKWAFWRREELRRMWLNAKLELAELVGAGEASELRNAVERVNPLLVEV